MTPALLIAFALLAPGGGRDAGTPEVRLDGGRFIVDRWEAASRLSPDRLSEMFRVFVDSGPRDRPALLGTYRLENGALIFEPRFPLQPGLRYRALLATQPPVVAVFDIPAPEARPPAHVERVFPSADRLPENQLKLYIHFSEPMSRGEVYSRVRLLDPHGEPVELPFLELEQELWDPGGRRLTLLFDPGRIKRGLVPHNEAGPALEAGARYALVIDAQWPDAEGRPLAAPFRKEFSVGEPDRTPLDPRAWRIDAPRAGTSDALTVDFHEPLDRALLERQVVLKDGRGAAVRGTARIENAETRWRFTPESPWKAGVYALAIGAALEDLAGNRIGRPFDVDLRNVKPGVMPAGDYRLPIRIQ